ncbi:MAG: radical SAM protein [Thermomicrobia bacterium]|nr:radical SAM protein [Thermomicrobia bacterium]MCA1725308.1 radical SAM protein [Thermomicrobia bacterium]
MELPTFVQIEPVGQCNLRCKMCAIQFREDGPPHGPLAFMDFAKFTALVDQFPALEELQLQGLGEPMMHPKFFDMVAYAAGRGVKVSTNTNLTLLNPRRAERCVTSGLDTLHFSIDGATAETYEGIRVYAKYERVIANLALLQETRARLDSVYPHLRMVTVLMRRNLHELPDLVRLAHRYGVSTMFVQHLCHDFGESSLPERYRPMREFVDEETVVGEDPARVDYYFAAARQIAAELNVDVRLPNLNPRLHSPGTPGRTRCGWPWSGAYLSYQGLAMPCCMVSTPDRANFGNMAEIGVEQIWNSDEYQAFRDRLDSDDPPEICQSCAVYHGVF